ncbi:MAG: sodium-independent anion transporter, partial [Bacteroidota bacterium]
LEGPLFFGSSNYFKGLVNQVKDVRFVVIRMEKVPYIDQSGLYAFEDSALSLETRGIQVLLSGLQVQARDQLERINMIPGLISEEHIFENFDACAAWLGEHAPAAMAS